MASLPSTHGDEVDGLRYYYIRSAGHPYAHQCVLDGECEYKAAARIFHHHLMHVSRNLSDVLRRTKGTVNVATRL
jgi:hypothetical protein